MTSLSIELSASREKLSPQCSVFGICGGCTYQDIPYEKELEVKELYLRKLLMESLNLGEAVFEPVLVSPKPYHYRQRLDIAMKKSQGKWLFGYSSAITKKMVEIDACPIAMEPVSDFLPRLRQEAEAMIPKDYRTANLVVRTGDDGRVLWGGIGRHSLVMKEEDYFWTEIEGKKIYYSLENFFQANLSILPSVIQKVRNFAAMDSKTTFLDLYAGVGLFGLCFAREVLKVVMVEDCVGSTKLARYNVQKRGDLNVEIRSGSMESELSAVSPQAETGRVVAMVDPPRAGLSQTAVEALSDAKHLERLLYLSCHPESLLRDLKVFKAKGWRIEKVVGMDFFPRTRHLETLVLLKP